jgi:prepilin-type processing-associated H-X9-DG protein
MKNVSLGLAGYATTNRGHYPAVLYPREGKVAGWTAEVLSQIDAQSISDRLSIASPPDVKLPVLVCPDDTSNRGQSRGLSYVVNVGYGQLTPQCIPPIQPIIHRDTLKLETKNISVSGQLRTRCAVGDFDGLSLEISMTYAVKNPDVEEHRLFGLDWDGDGLITGQDDITTTSTGVFWSSNERTNRTFHTGVLDSGDGSSNTLMLSERHRRRDWIGTELSPTVNADLLLRMRYLATVSEFGFGMSTQSFRNAASQHVMPKEDGWLVQPVRRHLKFDRVIANPYGRADCVPYVEQDLARIVNAPSKYSLGLSAWHRGGVNAAFCDGRVSFLSNDISPGVFAQLLTSRGQRFGESVLSDSDF